MELLSTIIVAVLSLIGTIIGSTMANSKSTALIGYRIEQLEKRVEQHNSVVERMYKCEKDINEAFLKIDELEKRA